MVNKIAFLVIILLMAALSIVAHAAKPKDTLVIAISSDFQPFTFLNAEGKPAGMFIDIWQLWGQKTGRNIEFVASDWKTSLENLKSKKADIHSGLVSRPELSEWLGNSQAFYNVGFNLFYHLKQGKITDIRELSENTVAAVKGTHTELFLKKNYPEIRILSCETREELIKVSREGKAKAFVAGFPVGKSLIDRMGLSGEFEALDKPLYSEKIQPGIAKENTELIDLINKGFNAISEHELADIEARWILNPTQRQFKTSGIIDLTSSEKAWIEKHKTIRVGLDPIFPPLKFSENGVIKGIEPDYLELLSEYTGIKFEHAISKLTVLDAKVKAGEVDMFISFNIPERLSYMTFTETLFEFKQVIIARNDAPFISGLAALQGKRFATVKGVKLYDKLLAPYPDIELVWVDNMEDMFRAVSESKADALISKTFYAGYTIKNYPNLKIAGIADLPPEPYLYAVRKDYPELVSILNKAIKAIPKDRVDAITQKWFTVHLDYRPRWSEILKWFSLGIGIFALILGVILYWNRRLKREIEVRKQVEDGLEKIKNILSDGQKIAHLGTFEYEHDTQTTLWSEEEYRIYGLNPEGPSPTYDVMLEKNIHPDDVALLHQSFTAAIQRGSVYELVHRIVWPDGSVRWVHDRANPYFDQNGKLVRYVGSTLDITERKVVEDKLIQSNEQLQLVLAGSQLGFWDWNIETGEVARNERWAEMLGYTLSEINFSANQWTDLIHPDDREQAWKSINDHLEGYTPLHEIEYRMLTKDGQYRWILDRAKIVKRNADGKPVRMSGTHTDITERKRSEDILQDIINKNPMSIQILDKDGFTLTVNPAHTMLFGAVPPADYCLFTDSQLLRQGFGELLLRGKSGEVVQFPEFYYNAHDFKKEFPDVPVWIRMLIFPLKGDDNKPERFVLMHDNITERKMAEDALRESEFRWKFALEGSGDGVWDWRPNEVSYSKRWKEMLGYAEYDMPDHKEWMDRIHPDDQSYVAEAMQAYQDARTAIYVVEFRVRCMDENYKWILSRGMAVSRSKEGNILRMIGTHTDITDRKKAEEEKLVLEHQLQHTQKLESLGVLSGGIAHDFNNILAIIIGYCGLTRMDYETAEKNINEIEKAAERAAALCRQMLAYAGKAQLTMTQVNMSMLVDEMNTMLRSTLPKNAVVKLDLSADIPFIDADASQLRQVVMNLIINASEAIGTEQGEVNVSLSKVMVIAVKTYEDYHGKPIPPGEYVCLEVTDNGCGMDEATKWRIFEPFYTTKFSGRGLGMSAVLGIIKSHGGALQLFSQLGQGSTFKVYLPAPTSDTAGDSYQTLSAPSAPWRGSGTILLVEDEDPVRQIAKALLKRFGFTVLEAVNGKEALEIYKKNAAEIALVFTDMGMPIMDGYELFHKLKSLKPELPIIISSGYGDVEVSSRIGSDNIAGLISKPYNPDQLREVLKRVVEGVEQ